MSQIRKAFGRMTCCRMTNNRKFIRSKLLIWEMPCSGLRPLSGIPKGRITTIAAGECPIQYLVELQMAESSDGRNSTFLAIRFCF